MSDSMGVRMEEGWKRRLQPEFDRDYFQKLRSFVREEYRTHRVFPKATNLFRAFDLTPFENTRVVVLGQDPYHGDGQATGLCFAVEPGVALPPSLENIFKELREDLGREPFADPSLTSWAKQGVLLLNAILSVRAHQAASHQGMGWEEFTDAALRVLNEDARPKAFVLWGAYAQRKGAFLDASRHLVLSSPHPSPFSAYRGFFGSRPFSGINRWLKARGEQEIEW